jgi:hypothetical protein
MLFAVLRKRLNNNVSVSPRGADKDSNVIENDAMHFGTYVPTFRAIVTLPGLTKRYEARRCSTRRYIQPVCYSPHLIRPNKNRLPIILG